MAVVTKDGKGNNSMADDAAHNQADDAPEIERTAPRPPQSSGGFFSIYKSGQGYWTRMCTAGGVLLVLIILHYFIFDTLRNKTELDFITSGTGARERGVPWIKSSIVGGLFVVVAAVIWRYMNKPVIVDFFIATESEMKKVNWTSRKDLIGSTKVVIFFMLLIAAVLFVFDLAFGFFFFKIGVLKSGPFG
jgi:preprotein translocase SecE subunit